MPSDSAVDAFYASRNGAPLWLVHGQRTPAAASCFRCWSVRRSTASQAVRRCGRSASAAHPRAGRRPAAAAQADRLLSAAWVHYVQAIQRPATGMTYEVDLGRTRMRIAARNSRLAAAAPSLASHVPHRVRREPLLRTASRSRLAADAVVRRRARSARARQPRPRRGRSRAQGRFVARRCRAAEAVDGPGWRSRRFHEGHRRQAGSRRR